MSGLRALTSRSRCRDGRRCPARSSRPRRRRPRPASRTPAAPRTTPDRAAASACRDSGSRRHPPCGALILTTSAPNSSSSRPQVGPARATHRSSTRMPCSGCARSGFGAGRSAGRRRERFELAQDRRRGRRRAGGAGPGRAGLAVRWTGRPAIQVGPSSGSSSWTTAPIARAWSVVDPLGRWCAPSRSRRPRGCQAPPTRARCGSGRARAAGRAAAD